MLLGEGKIGAVNFTICIIVEITMEEQGCRHTLLRKEKKTTLSDELKVQGKHEVKQITGPS